MCNTDDKFMGNSLPRVLSVNSYSTKLSIAVKMHQILTSNFKKNSVCKPPEPYTGERLECLSQAHPITPPTIKTPTRLPDAMCTCCADGEEQGGVEHVSDFDDYYDQDGDDGLWSDTEFDVEEPDQPEPQPQQVRASFINTHPPMEASRGDLEIR